LIEGKDNFNLIFTLTSHLNGGQSSGLIVAISTKGSVVVVLGGKVVEVVVGEVVEVLVGGLLLVEDDTFFDELLDGFFVDFFTHGFFPEHELFGFGVVP